MTVPLTSLYENWTLHKRLPGAHPIFSREDNTILCNQLYLIHTKDKTSQSLGKTVKVCCCQCSYNESSLVSTWYAYSKWECYKCGEKIRDIYKKAL